ncbi:fructose-specific PTS transporter subunit EIIC [Amphibacillus sp. MSJ-3]|uniref:PTS fructose transporter subunit IIABC n=1 Tax=Amphibacillus sp. MSJ-3 TaxID=2841505 RepID=UPI001C0EC858|nr:fructose-specific PTS transporter subunit EIIC [Amphibacillus sp. MSJ-3]MBU5593862.1 fructose-specific PTS transporter subunit EIIC [Amphibacillus sp. MSJ-3]
MNMNDLMREELMILSSKSTSKKEILDEMTRKLVETGAVDDYDTFRQAISEREENMTTGIGDGIAMPHAKNQAVKKTSVVFAKHPTGIDFDSLDGQPARLFFMIAAKDSANDTHLSILSNLSKLLMNKNFTEALYAADTPQSAKAIISLAEAGLEQDHNNESPSPDKKGDEPYVIAVTACPTGIAHTYMAEDALKNKAKEMGIKIKVETNGSDGVKNQLTDDDIKKADGIIVAVGKKVSMARFDGKRVVERPVADGINKSEELINQALSGKAPIYQANQSDRENDSDENNHQEKGHFSLKSIYNDLMSGVSNMLPFVIAGGIILALSYLLEGFVGKNSPIFIGINEIGSAAFSFLIPVLAGYIAMSIGGKPAMVSGFAGGALAVNADAGFLGGLIAGFLAGYITLIVIKWLKDMPKNLSGLRTILLYPILTLFFTGLFMYFIFGPVFANINIAMLNFLENLGAGNQVLLGAILGAMMATDMGGPINKAAYAFSIGIFTDTGDGSLMAAVMVGGMIPPLAIALASVIFKNKFTEVQHQSALTNFVLGLSFITEGAIPFAAADPIRVIGSSMVGSAIGGGLTQLWLTKVPAPHGGIFTMLALGDNRLMLMLAVLIGTLISAIILGLWKKPLEEQIIAE